MKGALARWRPWLRENGKRAALTGGLLVVFFGNQGFVSLIRNWAELRQLKREIAGLEVRRAQETERLKLIGSGDSAVERLARRELGYIKKGEIEYRFPPPKPAQ